MDQSQLRPQFFTEIQSSKKLWLYITPPKENKKKWVSFPKAIHIENLCFRRGVWLFLSFPETTKRIQFNGLSLTPIPLSTKCEATKCTNQDYSFQNQAKDDIVMWWKQWAHQFCPRKSFICLKKKSSGFTNHLETEKIWMLTCLLTSKKNEPNCKQLHY